MAIDSLVHITDLHFWEVVWNPLHLLNKRALGNFNVWYRRRHEFIHEHEKPFADTIAATGIKQAYISGDFCSTATAKEFREGAKFIHALEKHGMDVIAIPGNHDVYTHESVRRRRFERYLGDWYPEEGLPARRKLPGGTDLLLVPTVCPNFISSRGVITPVEIEGVVEHLRRCASPVIVSGHYPVLNETYTYRTTGGRELRNAHRLRRALGESGKDILYICGHVHRFSYVQDDLYPNLKHLTSGALFRLAHETKSRGEFTEVHREDGGFSIIRHMYREDWSCRKEPLREHPMRNEPLDHRKVAPPAD